MYFILIWFKKSKLWRILLILSKYIVYFFQLEARLAEKEENLLEKDLIFEQVNRLVDRVKNKAEGGKEDTLELAKKVRQNRIQWNTSLYVSVVFMINEATFKNVDSFDF